ncbi:FAD-dependent oxidoreductase [Mycobacterium vicinigordonae]|uniref:FAD-dependent oxidoreductase n=1 Tax=Mycobacterium vicinigordonae TaxID=1719132 RepID=UPI001FEA71F6|nr:FAD-dependent oxidoreductase [Mycobacterium vicinigordonae]
MDELGSRAVVLGAGMAGLLAARVLSEFYTSVTLVERDVLPDRAEQRKGVPQGRHLHHFLSRGTQVIGELFPGILDELAVAGAVVDDSDDLSRQYIKVFGYELKPAGRLADPGSLTAYQASRPFMECHLRRRVASLDNVTILDDHEFDGLELADNVVTGARITNRDNGTNTVLDAALVVDATGRAQRTAHCLKTHGFGTAPEEAIPSVGGYSCQLLRIPLGQIHQRIAFVNQGVSAPGALLVAYEDNTWMLAIVHPAEKGSPPCDLAEMIEAAEQMLPATIMAGLRNATPAAEISISRTTAAAWRRYDRMLYLPTGLIALGDALCNFNPLHGQGMTMASLEAVALRDCLRTGRVNLPQRYYRATTEQIAPVWAANRANDRAPATVGTRDRGRRLRGRLQLAAVRAAATDVTVAEPILRVRGLIDPASRLQDPSLFLRIVRANLRSWFVENVLSRLSLLASGWRTGAADGMVEA